MATRRPSVQINKEKKKSRNDQQCQNAYDRMLVILMCAVTGYTEYRLHGKEPNAHTVAP